MTKITITTNDLVPIQAAAKELRVDFTTIYRWIRSGQVIAFWIGKQRYLTRATLELLKEQRMKAEVQPLRRTLKRPWHPQK